MLKVNVYPGPDKFVSSDADPVGGSDESVKPVAGSSDDALIAEWKKRQAVTPDVGGDSKQLIEEYQRRKTQPAAGEGVVAKPGKAAQPESFQQRINKSAEEVLRDFSGRDADIDYTAEAPWSVRYQVGRMDNPSEVKKYLKKFYGDSDFGQDRGGRWWIREGGKKVPIDVGLLPGMAATAPTQAGAMIGGAAGGAVGGPVGMIAGTGLGAAGGKAADEASKFLQGTFSKTPEEEASVLGGEAALNAGMSVLGPMSSGAGQLARTKFFGVTPQSAQTGAKLLERGVRPPIGSIAPEATGFERKRQLSAAVSGDPYKKEKTEYVDREMRGVLASTGMNPHEIEAAMGQIRNTAVAIEGRRASEGIVESVNRRMTEMEDRISGNLELATRALDYQGSAMRAWANAPVGQLGTEAADAIRNARATVGAQFDRLYEDVDQLAGSEHVVDLTNAIREADTIARQYEFAPGAIPQPIRNLLNREQTIERARQQVEQLMQNGQPVPSELMEWANREVHIASIAEAHALRSELRRSAKMWNLPNLTPEASYAMLSAVEDHVDNAFTTLAASRDPALQLGAEAARNLRRVDSQYRGAISPFKSAVLNKVLRDARSNLTPDPEVVAKFIMRPGQEAATREILSYLSPAAREDVTRAHLRGLVGESSYRNEQNQVVVNGKKLLDVMDKNERPMRQIYPPEFLDDMRRFGAEVAAKDGEIEVGALRDPTAIRDMLRRHVMERDARDVFVRENPIAALNSQHGPNVDSALAEISAPKREAKTESLFALLRPEQRQQVQQWAIKTMFQSAIKETSDRGVTIDGDALRRWTGQYTDRQLDMLLGHGVSHDILELGNDVKFLFPDPKMGAGASQAEVGVTSKGYFNPLALGKRYSWLGWTLAVHQPQVLRWFANVHKNDPGKARQLMGAFGRWAVNAESSGPGSGAPPPEKSAGGNQIPKLAEGGVVTQPTVAMIGEQGPEAVVPLDDPAAAQQAADVAAARVRAPYAKAQAQHSPSGLLDIGDYYGDKLMNAMMAPHDALMGSLQVTDPETGMPTPEAMQRGKGVASMAMTGGIPMAQRGAAGMAGGKLGGPGDRINFQSAGAQRGEVPGKPQEARAPMTPEEKVEWKKRADAEMQAHLEKMSKTKEGKKAILDAAKGLGKAEEGGERVGFKSLGTKAAGPGEALPKLRSAFDSVRAAQGNVGIAPISELIAQSGLSKEEVHQALLDAAKRGEVTLHRGNQAGESAMNLDAAIQIPGEPPFMYAFFKDKPKGAEPKGREEIRRELREGRQQFESGTARDK